VLKARNGRPFVEPTPAQEETGGHRRRPEAVMSPSALAADASDVRPDSPGARLWRAQARAEGLRGL